MKLLVDFWYDAQTASELAELGCHPFMRLVGSKWERTEDEDGLPDIEGCMAVMAARAADGPIPRHIHIEFEADDLTRDYTGREGANLERGRVYAKRVVELTDRIREDIRPDAEFSVYAQTTIDLWRNGKRFGQDAGTVWGSNHDSAYAQANTGELDSVSLYSWTPDEDDAEWRFRMFAGDSDVLPILHHRFVDRGDESKQVGGLVPFDVFVRQQLAPILRLGAERPPAIQLWTGGDRGEHHIDNQGKRRWFEHDPKELRRRGRAFVQYAALVRRMFPEAR